MTPVTLAWVCQRPDHDGWEVYLEWPDGEEWTLCAVATRVQADRVRGKLLHEIEAWGWRSPGGAFVNDPKVPLMVLATLWRMMTPEAFNSLWRGRDTHVGDESHTAGGSDSPDGPDEEQFEW